jgi:hypothetical protein
VVASFVPAEVGPLPAGSPVSAPGLPLQPIITGSYRDRFEKVDGAWRFSERRELVGETGDLSAHLLRDFRGPTGE